jgi:ABC-type nickel/cobalt efflux system permease component RcnA
MSSELIALLGTATGVGVAHTAVGLDHFLPFVVLGRARQWSLSRTLFVTSLCSIGHVLSSVLVGWIAYFGLGLALERVEGVEQARGQWAAWGLMTLGLAYMAWGVWQLRRGQQHQHWHLHRDGTLHEHAHAHAPADASRTDIAQRAARERLARLPAERRRFGRAREPQSRLLHEHAHGPETKAGAVLTPSRLTMTLFVIFLLGPCEPLIPLMALGALGAGAWAPLWIAACFGAATLLTMLALVALGYLGLSAPLAKRLGPHLQWLAGLAILLTGVGVEFLGL